MNRRGFLRVCLATACAPAIVHASSLMKIAVPSFQETIRFGVTGSLGYGSISEELAWVTRRAFVPGIVANIYNASPLMTHLLKADEAAEHILTLGENRIIHA